MVTLLHSMALPVVEEIVDSPYKLNFVEGAESASPIPAAFTLTCPSSISGELIFKGVLPSETNVALLITVFAALDAISTFVNVLSLPLKVHMIYLQTIEKFLKDAEE